MNGITWVGESGASGRIVEIGLLEVATRKDSRGWPVSRIFKRVKKSDWLATNLDDSQS